MHARAGAETSPRGLRFLVIGDWGRAGHYYQTNVAQAMGAYAENFGPSFVISTGDNFYMTGVRTPKDPAWNESFEDIYTANSLQSPPWFTTFGNHDYGGSISAQLERHMRGRWRMPGKWYPVHGSDFGAPDVDLFFLDTITWEGSENWFWRKLGDTVVQGEPEEQDAWLEQQLQSSKARAKFVFGHYPIYSIGNHGGSKRLRCLDRLLCEYGVTAYVCGHDHCMYHISRTRMMGSKERIHYVCSGAGSQMLSSYSGGAVIGCVLPGACGASARETSPIWHKFLGDHRTPPKSAQDEFNARGAFASFEVWPDRTRMQFIDGDNVVRHEAIIPTATKPAAASSCFDDRDSAYGGDPKVGSGPPERCKLTAA